MRKETNLLRKTFTYNGKRYDVYGKTKKELKQKQEQKINEIMCKAENESNISVRDWSKICVETYKTNLTTKGLKTLNNCMNACIIKYIGDMQVRKVTPLICQQTINHQKGKSNNLINTTYQLLNFIFQKAVDNDIIIKNPTKSIIKPSGKAYIPRRSLTPNEEVIFLCAVEKIHHAPYFMLIYGCGCRPSEAAKVEGRDIMDVQGRRFLHIRGTKSRCADRYVPLPYEVERHFPRILTEDQRVCVTEFNTPLNEQGMKRAWYRLKREMNILMGCEVYRNKLIPPLPLASDLSTYCLRHTYCTNLKKRGVDIRTAQYLMGHADIKMTANIYTHIDPEQLIEEYDIINGTNNTAVQTAVQSKKLLI